MTSETRNDSVIDMVIDSLKKFAEKHLSDEKCLELDKNDQFPEELIKKMLGPDLGLHLVFIPEKYNGIGGSAYDIYRLSEEMARIDLGVATSFLAISLGTDPIMVGGTLEQKEKWLTKIADEGLIVAYAVTEPGAGSDLTRLSTRATKLENGNYKLNGVKQFITNGGVASIYSVLALTDSGPTFFIVESNSPGLSRGKHEDKHGIRASNTAQVILEDVEVTPDRIVGGVVGKGLEQATKVFGYTRLMVAAFGLGGGEEALRRAIKYAKERVQFGEAIIEKEGLMHGLIIPAFVRLEASRAYIEYVAERLDQGEEDLSIEGAIAKLFATEAGNFASDIAIQVHGGYGYTREYVVEKIKRDIRITTIYEGTSEIMRQTIARDRWRRNLQQNNEYYNKLAAKIFEEDSEKMVGGEKIAKAAKVLSKTMEIARINRLTRNQSVLFKLADAMTYIEVGYAFCKKALDSDEKIKIMARLHARDALRIAVETAVNITCGAGNIDKVEVIEDWPKEFVGMEDDFLVVSKWLKE